MAVAGATGAPSTKPRSVRAGKQRGQATAGRLGSPVRRNLPVYLAISPFYVLFAVFGVFPVVFSLYLSFQDWDGIGTMRFVGWQQYDWLLHDSVFWKSILNTFEIWFLSTVPMLFLALVIAFLLNSQVRYSMAYRVAYFIPNVTSMTARSGAEAVLRDVQVEEDPVGRSEVGRVPGRLQVSCGPAASGEGEAREPHGLHAQCGAVTAAQLRPSDVRPGSVLLRHHVRGLQSVHCRREAADPRRRPAVRVRLARPEAEPPDLAQPARHRHAYAEPRQSTGPVARRLDADGERQARFVGGPPVLDRHPGRLGRRRHPRTHQYSVRTVRHLVDAVQQPVQTRPAPPPHR
ncbi:hypothetical protein SALBM311S_07952 [Streptomyces alboniger]